MYRERKPAMIDQTTPKGRILAGALECAARKKWSDVTLLDIAQAGRVSLSELREQFASKNAIIAGLVRTVDDEVLKQAAKRGEEQRAGRPAEEEQQPRDRLFDVIMTRFDVLGPYKAALKSIYASGPADFSLAQPFLSSQHWMLQAAGIGTDGPTGGLRVAGLGLVYASVFRTWLDDDDPGLARTMAALDRRLRRGERSLSVLEESAGAAQRVADAVRDALRSVRRGRERRTQDSSPGADVGTV
jgi:AcrR family transcriptional regulator